MAFSTPFCKSLPSLLLPLLLLPGCDRNVDEQRFSIQAATIEHRSRALTVAMSQQLRLSPEAVEALENGVTLTLSLETELRDSSNLSLIGSTTRLYEIRYLPLSRHYELVHFPGAERLTYPRLRHVLRALGTVQLKFETGPLAPGDYEVRTRTRLLQDRLPAPMQLPALLSAEWRHDSRWSTWPLKISA